MGTNTKIDIKQDVAKKETGKGRRKKKFEGDRRKKGKRISHYSPQTCFSFI